MALSCFVLADEGWNADDNDPDSDVCLIYWVSGNWFDSSIAGFWPTFIEKAVHGYRGPPVHGELVTSILWYSKCFNYALSFQPCKQGLNCFKEIYLSACDLIVRPIPLASSSRNRRVGASTHIHRLTFIS